MSNRSPNIVFIMSDEHDAHLLGSARNRFVHTPNLDALAASGAVFENAYCNYPLCVPSRYSCMTGRYAHSVGGWDNGSPFPPSVSTMGDHLGAAGYDTYLCGKSYFVGRQGFSHRLGEPLPRGERRFAPPDRSPGSRRNGGDSHFSHCGRVESAEHTEIDRNITDRTVRFLESRMGKEQPRPWLLYVGLQRPHFPLLADEQYFDRYFPDRVEMPPSLNQSIVSQHPMIQSLRRFLGHETPASEDLVRTALAAYYGLVTFVDEMVGRIAEIVAGDHNTMIIYTSDHGESGGHHGLWQKNCFYEHAVRVPLITHGAGIRPGQRVDVPVSLVDILPTFLDIAGQPLNSNLPGTSLLTLLKDAANGNHSPLSNRAVFAEYHAMGMERAAYMVRRGRYKLNYYVDHRPELFNLEDDPEELSNLAGDEPEVRESLTESLRRFVDPEEVDSAARANQSKTGNARLQTPIMLLREPPSSSPTCAP